LQGSDGTARALWYVSAGTAEIRDERLGPPAQGSVRVRALHGAISRGTESLVAAGRVPPSEHRRMRAPFMAGEFPFPVKYGYATVGRVEAGPPALAGRAVFTLYPHQTLFDIPADAAVPLPPGLPPARAVLAANMETALNAVWDAGPGPFASVAVVGAGVVGALTGLLCKRFAGADVTLVDINPARAEVAHAFGLGFAQPATAPTECDLVIHTSASAAGLVTALNLAGDEATVLELSWYGTQDVAVPLGGAFHSRRLRLVSSQVGKVADDRLDVLFAPPMAFDDLPSQLTKIFAPQSGVLCQRIDYP
jgi:hypothetical protein